MEQPHDCWKTQNLTLFLSKFHGNLKGISNSSLNWFFYSIYFLLLISLYANELLKTQIDSIFPLIKAKLDIKKSFYTSMLIINYKLKWDWIKWFPFIKQFMCPFLFYHKNWDLQRGHSLLLLLLNHFMIQLEWNFFLHVLHDFLGMCPFGSTMS